MNGQDLLLFLANPIFFCTNSYNLIGPDCFAYTAIYQTVKPRETRVKSIICHTTP